MTPASKPFWHSKTVWVQALAITATFIPPVAAWLTANPVEFVAALAAVNTLVRFATRGSLSIFPDDAEIGGKSGGSSAGSALLAMTATAAGLAMAGGLLSSCVVGVDERGDYSLRPDPRTMDVALKYLIRHEEDEDAKGGLTTWTYHDPATGALIPEEDYAAWGIKPGATE